MEPFFLKKTKKQNDIALQSSGLTLLNFHLSLYKVDAFLQILKSLRLEGCRHVFIGKLIYSGEGLVVM